VVVLADSDTIADLVYRDRQTPKPAASLVGEHRLNTNSKVRHNQSCFVMGSAMDDEETNPEQPTADYIFFRGGQELGTLTIGDSWFPWYQGEFHPTPGFEEVRPLFEELSLMPTSDAFEKNWAKVKEPGVCLNSLHEETTFDTFILHNRKDRFRLRILKFD